MASFAGPLVKQFLAGRSIASLASSKPEGGIHTVAVGYWFDGTANIRSDIITQSQIPKLGVGSKVSMIDSRDPAACCGITALGVAKILSGDPSRLKNAEIHQQYLSAAAVADPRVGAVFAGWDDITIQINPTSILGWDRREADRQVFGSSFAGNRSYLPPLEH